MDIYKKIHELQRTLNSYEWEKDGINRYQSYKYITEAQYKRNFAKALIEVGLIWKVDEVDRRFTADLLDKMHLVEVDFIGTLIDIETGESIDYLFSGTGADNGDKAVYKAYTGGLKYFIATNFLIAEGNDPENDSDQPVSRVPASKDERAEIKSGLTDGTANKMQINALKKQMAKLIEKDPSHKEFIKRIIDKHNDLKTISKTECENYILEIGGMLDD